MEICIYCICIAWGVLDLWVRTACTVFLSFWDALKVFPFFYIPFIPCLTSTCTVLCCWFYYTLSACLADEIMLQTTWLMTQTRLEMWKFHSALVLLTTQMRVPSGRKRAECTDVLFRRIKYDLSISHFWSGLCCCFFMILDNFGWST